MTIQEQFRQAVQISIERGYTTFIFDGKRYAIQPTNEG